MNTHVMEGAITEDIEARGKAATQALVVATKAIEGFRERVIHLEAELREAREKQEAVEQALTVDLDSIPEPTALHKDSDAVPPHLFAGTATVCFWCGCEMDEEPHLDRILHKEGD